MRKIFFIILSAVILASCSGPKQAAGTTSNTNVGVPAVTQDGSFYDKAIFIDERNESAGVTAEYKWLKKNHPGYKTVKQALDYKGKRSYDIITIKTAGGQTVDVYFDITQFFGKM